MFKRILAAVDDSERARLVMQVGRSLATRAGGALVVLRVRPPHADRDVVSDRDAALAEQTQALRVDGMRAHYLVHQGRAERQIIETAQLQHSTLIVIASRREEPFARQRRMTARLAAHSPVPVLVAPERGPASGPQPRAMAPEDDEDSSLFGPDDAPLLVALDGSSLAEQALPYAIELAALLERPLALIFVALPLLSQEDRAHAWEYIEEVRRRVHERIVRETQRETRVDAQVLSGAPVDELLWAAEGRRAGAIVLAARGQTGLASARASLLALEALRRVEIPALVIPTPLLASTAMQPSPQADEPTTG